MEEQLKELASQIAALAGQVAKIPDTVKAQVEAANAPVLERIGAVETKVAANPGAPAKDGTKDKGDKGGDSAAADIANHPIILKLAESLDTVSKTVGAMTTEKQTAAEAAATEQRVRDYVEKHYPNLKGKAAVVKRIIAAGPKDDAAVKAAIDGERAYAEEVGADVKPFTAAPLGEGGAPAKPADPKEERLAQIRQDRAEKIAAGTSKTVVTT